MRLLVVVVTAWVGVCAARRSRHRESQVIGAGGHTPQVNSRWRYPSGGNHPVTTPPIYVDPYQGVLGPDLYGIYPNRLAHSASGSGPTTSPKNSGSIQNRHVKRPKPWNPTSMFYQDVAPYLGQQTGYFHKTDPAPGQGGARFPGQGHPNSPFTPARNKMDYFSPWYADSDSETPYGGSIPGQQHHKAVRPNRFHEQSHPLFKEPDHSETPTPPGQQGVDPSLQQPSYHSLANPGQQGAPHSQQLSPIDAHENEYYPVEPYAQKGVPPSQESQPYNQVAPLGQQEVPPSLHLPPMDDYEDEHFGMDQSDHQGVASFNEPQIYNPEVSLNHHAPANHRYYPFA